MADSKPASKTPPPAGPGKDMSMEMRLLLALVLMGVVMFITPYFYGPQPEPPPATEQVESTPAPETAETSPATPEPAPTTPAVAPAPAASIAAESEQTHTLETPLYRVVFSNRGAVVQSWILKEYKNIHEETLELVNEKAVGTVGYPFSLEFEGPPPADLNRALYAVKPAEDGLSVEFEYASSGVVSRKAFRFSPDRYLVEMDSELTVDRRPLPHRVAWRGGFGDPTTPNYTGVLRSVYLPATANSLEALDSGDAKDGPMTVKGAYTFAGVEDQYFALLFLPPPASNLELKTFSDNVPDRVTAEPSLHVGAAVSADTGNQFRVFVGPKSLSILNGIDPRLATVVDFGWFWFIAQPLFLALNWLATNYLHNWGWAIIVLTVAINFALMPLKLTSLKSMKKMQALQPQIAAINEKYKGIGLRDPRKQQQNQEMMALYQKHGVNPLGGCLPIALQIPFFFAFYKVLSISIEIRGADWLWVADLSQPEQIPIRILPLAMMVSQFVMQKMTPTPSADPTQQKIMLLMPLLFGFMFYSFSSGLVLYWLTSNLVGIAQQVLINKLSAPVVIPQPAPQKSGKRRK